MVPPYKAGDPIDEIVVKLGNRTKRQIYSKASHLKIKRPRRAPKLSGMDIVDMIRRRAFDKNYTMEDLDEWTGSNRYFVAPQTYNWRAIRKALEVLGGRIVPIWPTQA